MLNIFISPGIGNGWYLYEQGNWYEGEWLEDKRHGRGFRRYKNGAKYNGNWCDNKKEGEGSMYWENNDVSNTFFFLENMPLSFFSFMLVNGRTTTPMDMGSIPGTSSSLSNSYFRAAAGTKAAGWKELEMEQVKA